MPATPILRATGLAAERDGRWLFRSLDIELAAGEILRIEGRNGAGKTTLLRILAGLDQDFEGRIAWATAEKADRPWRQDALYLGHQPGVKNALTPVENLVWLLALRGLPPRCDVRAALAQVGLAGFEDVPVGTLSAGQRRRVALARLHLEDAPVWILDEPFTAIDRAGVETLEKLVAEHAGRGGSVMLTTHHALAINTRSLSLDQRTRHASAVVLANASANVGEGSA